MKGYFTFPLDMDWKTFNEKFMPEKTKNFTLYFIELLKDYTRFNMIFQEHKELLNKYYLLRNLSRDLKYDIKNLNLEESFKRTKSIQYDREENNEFKEILNKLAEGTLYRKQDTTETILHDSRLACKFYKDAYEAIGNTHLKNFVKKINNKNLNIGLRLKCIKGYKSEKYKSLFLCVDPLIRNSIEHKDYEILPQHNKIEFRDKDKNKSLSLFEFKKLCQDIMFLDILSQGIDLEQAMNGYKIHILKEEGWLNFF